MCFSSRRCYLAPRFYAIGSLTRWHWECIFTYQLDFKNINRHINSSPLFRRHLPNPNLHDIHVAMTDWVDSATCCWKPLRCHQTLSPKFSIVISLIQGHMGTKICVTWPTCKRKRICSIFTLLTNRHTSNKQQYNTSNKYYIRGVAFW